MLGLTINHFVPVCPLQVLSPTYKQRNEDFRKLFKQLPDTERLIVGEKATHSTKIHLQC